MRAPEQIITTKCEETEALASEHAPGLLAVSPSILTERQTMVILFDKFNLPEDLFEVVFATKQQKIVAKLLFHEMKDHEGEMNKTEMSMLATRLHDGNIITELDEPEFKGKKIKISYNKRQFYDRILTPMKSMGMIDYDLYRKTYRLSEKFKDVMMELGIMWSKELRKKTKIGG
ncbi:hypothetical protein COT48_02780 [Candidatus Woesearchaeota archaeon CG08_land_8_20_14_0_20_47_9]|nr:MAG: hypothetical protein COT48_02780 [Candidatus Woesearchaeota archaeon CG08_land_8_20_14_0_20_47_9]